VCSAVRRVEPSRTLAAHPRESRSEGAAPACRDWWAGYTTQDIDASREIWKFFAERPMPDAETD
jgi:hypothetical protein